MATNTVKTVKLLANYAMRAYEAEIQQNVANTAGYHSIDTGYRLSAGNGLLIHLIFFHVGVAILQDLVVAGDELQVGLFSGTDSTDFNTTNAQKYVSKELVTAEAAPLGRWEMPLTIDLSMLPGGGIIVPPQPLYAGLQTFGAAAAYTIAFEMWYTPVSIPKPETLEMVLPFIPQDV